MSEVKVTVTFKREEADDGDADLSYLTQDYKDEPAELRAEYRARDEQRRISYNRGNWHMIGIRAVATIWVDRGNYKTQYTMESAGLWGIESDSDEKYLQDVFMDECLQLRADIEAIGQAVFK